MAKKEIDILIIEDSPTDTELLMEKVKDFRVFNCQGRVKYVKKMKEAETLLVEKYFDVILLDLNLPDSRGIDSLKKIISIRKKAAVIIMTALSEQDIITEALNLGAQNYIVKGEESPVSLERAIMYSIEREKNIEEIKKSKKIQEEIIKNSPVMMFVLDENGKAISTNPETEKFSGKKQKDMLGLPSGAIFDCVNSFKDKKGCGHSKECETCPLAGAVREVFATEKNIKSKELKYEILKNNEKIEKTLLVSVTKIPVNGNFGLLVSVEDMTEMKDAQKKLIESEQKFSNAFFSSPVGMILTRLSDGKILECNKSIEADFGFKREEFIGKSTIELGLWVNDSDRKTVVERLSKGQPVVGMEFLFKNRANETVTCLYSCSMMEINNEKCALSTLFDISAQKKAEKENLFFAEMQGLFAQAVGLPSIYEIIASKLRELTGNGLVVVTATDEVEREIKITALSGLAEPAEKIVQALGMDLAKKTYYVSDMTADDLKLFRSGKLELLKEGIYMLATRKIPKVICDTLGKMLGVKYVYSVGFVADGRHFGGVSFLVSSDIIKHADLIERVVAYATIIIRKKQYEATTLASEEKYRQLYMSIGQGLALHEAIPDSKGDMVDYRFLEVNESFEKMTGLKAADITGKTARKVIPGLEQFWIDTYAKVVKTGKPVNVEHYVEPMKKYYSVYAYRPKPGQFATLVSDITERKEAEGDDKMFWEVQTAVYSCPDLPAIYKLLADRISGISGAITIISALDDSAEAMEAAAYSGLSVPFEKVIQAIGFDPLKMKYYQKDMTKKELESYGSGRLEKLEGGIYDLSNRMIPKVICDTLAKMLGIKSVFTMGFSTGGRHIAGLSMLSADESPRHKNLLERIAGFATGVINKKRMEEELRLGEEKFRAAFEQAAVGMSYTAPDGRLLSVNGRLCEMIGYTRQEAEKLNFRELTFPEDAVRDLEAIKKMLAGTQESYYTEKRYKRKDGGIIWIALTSTAVRFADKTVKFFISIIQDISERKQAEMENQFFIEVQAAITRAASLQEIYRILSDSTQNLVGQAVTLVTWLDESANGFRVACYSGLNEPIEKIIQMIKTDPTKIVYSIDKISDVQLGPFRTGNLERIEDGLYGLSVGQVPKMACDMIQKMLNVNFVYAIGFVSEGKHCGSLNIIASGDMGRYKKAIERVVQYAAVLIKRKIAEEALKTSEEKWSVFSDSVEDIMQLYDSGLKLVAANSATKKIYMAISGNELKPGMSLLEVLKGLEDTSRYNNYLEVMKTGKTFTAQEYLLKGKSPEPKYFSLKAFKVGSNLGMTIIDVTESKRSEIILKQSYEKLKDVDRLKSNFISIISHELRTPLTIIKGFTSFLIKEAAGPLNDNQKNFVNTIDINTARLARIINDMVDVSKIETGSFSIEKEKMELIGVINQAVDGMHHIVEEHGISLETVIELDSAHAEVDKGRMTQTITNLINNAMRFTGKGGTIKVVLKSPEKADIPPWISEKMNEVKNYYFICVHDNGAGIEKKYLEKIFERFYQVENANVRKHQGAGLGLSIAKTIIEAHHGFIWAESDGQGKGTKICIIIPE